MVKYFYLYILFSLISLHCISQNKSKIYLENADCESAINLTENYFGPFNFHGGCGAIEEFSNSDSISFYAFQKEHNSAWYFIQTKKSGLFYFDINSTSKKTDDINFLLYEVSNDSICYQIRSKTIKPIRSNLSINNIQTGYSTGLDLTSVESFVKKGQPNNYSQALEVAKGDQFILVLDHETKHQSGHKIELFYNTAVVRSSNDRKESKQQNKVSLTINTINEQNGQPIDIDIQLSEIESRIPHIVENTHSYVYILEKFKKYNIQCSYKGFLLYSGIYEVPKDSLKATLNLKLNPIVKGAKVALYNIRFKPNTTKILQSSEPELKTLLKFLEKNPEVKIRIIGHVNAPGQKNSTKAKNVSKSRAKSVSTYLTQEGIKANRIKFSGVGNAEMLYEKPKNHEEERSNRTIEIEIL